jgi:type IV secretory pathway TrbL component
VRKAKDAFDHLFRAGRSFREKDRERLAALNKDKPADANSKAGADKLGTGPAGRARPELAGGKTSGVLRNAPGEMKEDELGQSVTKGQVKVAPEYRKSLEDYYKAIAK